MGGKPPGEMLTDKVPVKRMDVSVIVEIRADDHQHQPLMTAPPLVVCGSTQPTLRPAAALLAVPASNLAHYQMKEITPSTTTAESDVIHLTVPQ